MRRLNRFLSQKRSRPQSTFAGFSAPWNPQNPPVQSTCPLAPFPWMPTPLRFCDVWPVVCLCPLSSLRIADELRSRSGECPSAHRNSLSIGLAHFPSTRSALWFVWPPRGKQEQLPAKTNYRRLSLSLFLFIYIIHKKECCWVLCSVKVVWGFV